MGLKWGDMYKRTNTLGFTSSDDAVHQPIKTGLIPPPSYDIREDLFERDEDFFLEMGEPDFQVGPAYPSYAPSQQPSTTYALQLPAINEDNDDEIYFPSYDDVECSDKIEFVESPTETTPITERPVSPNPIERPEDDSAIRVQPTRHVDYLSHDWSEEDVRASWQHIVSKRGAYNNSPRLENASWRSWAKKRSNLRTVPPETVKWMKDHDLTWLYGPLTPGSCEAQKSCSTNNDRRMLKAGMGRHIKKPILKKRSPSEIMLQRSISSSIIAKMGKSASQDYFPFESAAPSRSNTGNLSSRSGSGSDTSDGWKKVQFHGMVEQCIAVVEGGDEDQEQCCSESDEDVVQMRQSKKRATNNRLPAMQPKKQASLSKTIEKLPETPLKCNEALEDVPEEAVSDGLSVESASPSSLDENADPVSREDDSDEEDMEWQPPPWLRDRRDSVQIVKDKLSDIKMQVEAESASTQPARPHLERRDAVRDEEQAHVHLAPQKAGSDSSIKFELPPCRSQLENFSFHSGHKNGQPRDDYFMMADPGMTEGESEDSAEMSRSSSQSSDSIGSPGLGLDSLQRLLVNRVMDEFWVLFNQKWDSYFAASSPLSPTGSTTPLATGKRRRGGEKISSSRARRQWKANANHFNTIPEEAPPSPDSKELADYETYIHRELPRLVHESIVSAVGSQGQPQEAQLIGNLVSIIHDCQDKVFESYIDMTDRDDNTKGLGSKPADPFQPPRMATDEHHHSELLDAAFQQPPSQYSGTYRSSLRSSTTSDSTIGAPATPGEMVFSDSGYVSDITSTMTSPTHSRLGTDSNKYALPKEMRGKDPRTMKEWDIYDEIDEAVSVSWARGY